MGPRAGGQGRAPVGTGGEEVWDRERRPEGGTCGNCCCFPRAGRVQPHRTHSSPPVPLHPPPSSPAPLPWPEGGVGEGGRAAAGVGSPFRPGAHPPSPCCPESQGERVRERKGAPGFLCLPEATPPRPLGPAPPVWPALLPPCPAGRLLSRSSCTCTCSSMLLRGFCWQLWPGFPRGDTSLDSGRLAPVRLGALRVGAVSPLQSQGCSEHHVSPSTSRSRKRGLLAPEADHGPTTP